MKNGVYLYTTPSGIQYYYLIKDNKMGVYGSLVIMLKNSFLTPLDYHVDRLRLEFFCDIEQARQLAAIEAL